ncbi:restriction endonuclease [Niallia circulans]|uniref:Restriction endonuclease n=1 Tax=Niallia circulans TaxID=1397 RepID=A0A553SJ45_NIACI|nr:restriction endonuclease [Niallia circulans]TRZ37011.1 restriction endonuclease [Niallia circulans]
MKYLPYEIIEQMIQCFGKCFHYKDPMASFMRSCDVPSLIINKYRDLPKFVWARRVLEDLSINEDGLIIQRKLLTNLCKLRDLPDKEVLDRNAGLDALRKLKRLAQENDFIIKEEKEKENIQKKVNQEKLTLVLQRAKQLEELRTLFNNCVIEKNRQKAGFILEDLLKSLFELNDIEYRKSFRTTENTQQIDGYFRFDGFDYLVEAKWRKEIPNVAEIAGFKYKLETKIDSTRGLFVSINGFREEVIKEFSGKGTKIIFMDGHELMLILEGRITLKDGLRYKIEKAVQLGEPNSPLYLASVN